MQTHFPVNLTRPQLIAMIESFGAAECKLVMAVLQRRLQKLEAQQAQQEAEANMANFHLLDDAFLEQPLDNFGFNRYIRARYRTLGLNTVGDVVSRGQEGLGKIRNFGHKSWLEFETKVLARVQG